MVTAGDFDETSKDFLKQVAETLKQNSQNDSELASILEVHLLQSDPEQNAVNLAVDEIIKLADQRAKNHKRSVRVVKDTWAIETLKLVGFRGYLAATTFSFKDKKSLAVFAPNGYGKSSLVDAIEFFMSEKGTLLRLGSREVSNKAGPAALAHHSAGNDASVVIEASVNGKMKTGERSAVGGSRPMHEVADFLNESFSVSPIIRGHELRDFVDNHTLEERYKDVAGWLKIGSLVDVQRNVRLLRTKLKKKKVEFSKDQLVNRSTDDLSGGELNLLKAKVEGLLEPQAVRRIRKRLKLTQKDAGRLIGGGPNAFQKYESEDVLPSHAVTSALLLLNRDPKGLEVLKRHANAQ